MTGRKPGTVFATKKLAFKPSFKLQEFQLEPTLTAEAQAILSQVAGKQEHIRNIPVNSSPVFVGVHARRGDYLRYIRYCCRGQILSTEFYRDAMTVYREQFGPAVGKELGFYFVHYKGFFIAANTNDQLTTNTFCSINLNVGVAVDYLFNWAFLK